MRSIRVKRSLYLHHGWLTVCRFTGGPHHLKHWIERLESVDGDGPVLPWGNCLMTANAWSWTLTPLTDGWTGCCCLIVEWRAGTGSVSWSRETRSSSQTPRTRPRPLSGPSWPRSCLSPPCSPCPAARPLWWPLAPAQSQALVCPSPPPPSRGGPRKTPRCQCRL